MGTDYIIARQGPVEFVIDEHSNKLDLTIEDVSEEGPNAHLRDLTPMQLIAVATKMLRVASYWVADEKTIREAGVVALDYSKDFPAVEVK